MKPLVYLVAGAVAFGAGVTVGSQFGKGDLRAIKQAGDSLLVASQDSDRSIARHQVGDSAAVAEPTEAARVHLVHAESVGDSVPLLQHITDDAIARASASDSAASRAVEALATERAAEQREADEHRAVITAQVRVIFVLQSQVAYWRDTALVGMQSQRDKAQSLLSQSLTVKHRKCGPGVGLGAGYGIHGPDAGVFVGVSCVI